MITFMAYGFVFYFYPIMFCIYSTALLQVIRYGGFENDLIDGAFLVPCTAWSQFVTGLTVFHVPSNENIVTVSFCAKTYKNFKSKYAQSYCLDTVVNYIFNNARIQR